LTRRRRSSGGTARWWQCARSQMRQEMPMGWKEASAVEVEPVGIDELRRV
jgi:hypothetical protein